MLPVVLPVTPVPVPMLPVVPLVVPVPVPVFVPVAVPPVVLVPDPVVVFVPLVGCSVPVEDLQFPERVWFGFVQSAVGFTCAIAGE